MFNWWFRTASQNGLLRCFWRFPHETWWKSGPNWTLIRLDEDSASIVELGAIFMSPNWGSPKRFSNSNDTFPSFPVIFWGKFPRIFIPLLCPELLTRNLKNSATSFLNLLSILWGSFNRGTPQPLSMKLIVSFFSKWYVAGSFCNWHLSWFVTTPDRLGKKSKEINEGTWTNWLWSSFFQKNTIPETKTAPENGWLEYYFPIGMAYFQVLC